MSCIFPSQDMPHLAQSSSSLTRVEKTAAHNIESADQKGLISRGKLIVGTHKFLIGALIVSANTTLIFASWWWPKYFYIYLVFISLPLALNCVMIFNIICWQFKNHVLLSPNKVVPPRPETMVLLVPCYNETKEECTRSLDSLVEQTGVEQHQKAIMVVCDGKVRGPGMEKTCGQYLNEDILVDQTERKIMRSAYVAWDGQFMDVEIFKGTYRGVPFFCVVKQQNQGKRDSLIVARSFVHKFNQRLSNHGGFLAGQTARTVFQPFFFDEMCRWLAKEAGMDRVDFLIGMDADTIFAPDCIENLLQEAHYPNTVGVCGYVAVDFVRSGRFNPWAIYQATEYNIAQGLRRLHQSVVTHKVSCLPGCCQLLRVCEETCGDRVLIELFGYHPSPTDGMLRRIRATASEDRNHVCLMLMETPQVQTRQALFARAYTDVPRSLSVFLSQRRRWTLGATANDLMLVTSAPLRFNLWERLVALSNVVIWCLNFFVVASIASMVHAFLHLPIWMIMTFTSVMLVPVTYYVVMATWLPRTTFERVQFLMGLAVFVVCGPFINIGVSIYAIIYMDNFSWGKTRKVVSSSEDEEVKNGAPTVPAPAATDDEGMTTDSGDSGSPAQTAMTTTTTLACAANAGTQLTHDKSDIAGNLSHLFLSNEAQGLEAAGPPVMTPAVSAMAGVPASAPERVYLQSCTRRQPDEENQLY